MPGSASPIRGLRTRLARLRRRIRALIFAQGFTRWITAVVVAMVLFFLADWLLDLPLGVRRFVRGGVLDRPDGLAVASWIVLLLASGYLTIWSTRRRLGAAPVFAFAFGGIGAVLLWYAVRLLRPVSVQLPDEDLALTVEERYRSLNDRLAAALDFEEELEHPSRGESEAMMQVVLEEAEREAQGLAFVRAVSARTAFAWAGGALAALLVAWGITWAAPQTVDLWARRSLLLEDASWPRATRVVAVDVGPGGGFVPHDPATPYEVTVGRPLLVRALAQGRVPDEVILLDRASGTRPLPRRMFPVPDQEGLFQLEVRDVRRPFSFVLHGGDDTDDEPRYRVAITVPPRVLELKATLDYPAYLSREKEVVEGGNLQVPEGTKVTMTFTTDVPVTEARVLMQDAYLETTPKADDGTRFEFSFPAAETTRYRVTLKTATGRESDPAADTYEVRVVPDRPPRVSWIYPPGTHETTPEGRVPLLAVATDDHDVDDLTLEIRFAGSDTRRVPLLPFDPDEDDHPDEEGPAARGSDDAEEDEGERAPPVRANDGRYGREKVHTYLPLDLKELRDPADRPITAPAGLSLRLVATDSKRQRKEGPWLAVDVANALDLERRLPGRRSAVRSQIRNILAEQRARRDQVAGLIGQPIGEPERDLLKSVQFGQAKIAQDTDQAVHSLLDIFNVFVYARLGAENPNERVLSILNQWHRAHYGEFPDTSEETETVETRNLPTEAGDPAFPYALYDEIVAAWRDKRIYDTGLLDRMLAVVADAVDAASRRMPAAYHLTAKAAEDGAAGGGAALEDALAQQDAAIVVLERLLEEMNAWQSLNDLILQLRRILEREEALSERIEKSTEED